MIDRRIDLTANNTFSANNTITFLAVEHDGEMMTPEDYEAHLRWVALFGKRKHKNEKSDMFKKTDPFYFERICKRCGKEIRIPWGKRLFGRCRKCSNTLVGDERIPWSANCGEATADERGRDLFALR